MTKKLLMTLPLLLLLGAGAVWLYVNQQARAAVDNRIAQMLATGVYEDISYDSLQVWPNGDLVLGNLRVVAPAGEFILQDIQVSNFDYTREFPRNLNVSVRGLRLPNGLPPLADGSPNSLYAMLENMITDDTLPLEVDYLHSYAPEQNFQLDSDMRLGLPGAFNLHISSLSRNLDLQSYNELSTLDSDPAVAQLQLMEKMRDLEIATASLQLHDQGMVDSVVASMAQQFGATPEEMRTLLASQVSNLYLFAPQNVQQLAMDTGMHLATFLEGSKTLSVSVTPQLDGRMSELQTELMAAAFIGNFAGMADLLQLEITAE
jgi:hypothetical protein